MVKIMLDIFLILLFIAVAGLQIYVIFRIKELKATYDEFMDSQSQFVNYIEKARQSLMLVGSQANDVLPTLTKKIEESESLMQDFSFVLARANKKIDVLQEMSSLSNTENDFSEKKQSSMQASSYNQAAKVEVKEESAKTEFEHDPVLARLEKLEQQEQQEFKKEDNDFLKSDNSRALHQQELIEKALKEIL